jgi:outer membrane protein assembly factor BamB
MNPAKEEHTPGASRPHDLHHSIMLPVGRIKTFTALLLLAFPISLSAEDWPQWRGLQRDGVWPETGLLESFPAKGPNVLWRVPVETGFSSPVVVQGKVYVTDSHVTRTNMHESVRCLEAATGKTIWIHKYDVTYPEYGADPAHPFGPVATPVAADGRIYTLGRMSHLVCLDTQTGRALWSHNLPKEFNTTDDLRGFNSSPLIESNLVIISIAKSPQISMMAFDKDSGRQVWEALDEIPSNTSPIVIEGAGRRQLIVWANKSVAALEPATGRILWRLNIPPGGNYGVPTPVWKEDLLLLSGLMLKLDRNKPGASILWPDDIRPLRIYLSDTSTPLLQDGLAITPTSKGHLLCRDAASGKQLWQTNQISESKSGPSIHMTAVPSIRSVLLFTDRGDLILSKLTASGYQEHGGFHLLDPTSEYGQLKMAWVAPAYSGRRVFARNDKELVCASLATTPTIVPGK